MYLKSKYNIIFKNMLFETDEFLCSSEVDLNTNLEQN